MKRPCVKVTWLSCLSVCMLITGANAQTSYLENGVIRVGADLARGGAISYLSLSGSSGNVVNLYDLGRYIQQSYYAGPSPFIPPGATQHPAYAGWPWNPVQAGDVYGYRSSVLQWSNDGTTIYVKCLPKQWALNNVNSECTMESWITLDQNRVHVHNRLTNNRSDLTQYGASSQELPAVYTVGTLYKLYSYVGNQPFEGRPLTQIVNNGPPWAGWTTYEHWAALVNDQNWGLGVFVPGVTRIIGGFHGTPGIGNSYSNNTGYLAPIRPEILDHNIIYDFDYTLILGTLDEIRAYAHAHRPDLRPNYSYTQNRQHWYYANARDSGIPLSGCMQVDLSQPDPQLLGPASFWNAADAPRLRIEAAFHTPQSSLAEIRFATPHESFSDRQRLAFPIISDGQVRTYEVALATHPLYMGQITGIRLDPAPGGITGDAMGLYTITCAITPTSSSNIIPHVGVRASSELNCCGVGDRRSLFVVNGDGLGLPAGLADGAHATTPGSTMWTSHGIFTSPYDLNPEIRFDLHARYDLESIQIWNFNETGGTANGMKEFQILLSNDGVTYSALPGTYTLPQAPGISVSDFSHMIELPSGTIARYVILDVSTSSGVSNYGGGYSLVGLSEVRFRGYPLPNQMRPIPVVVHSVSSELVGYDRRAAYVCDGHDLFGRKHGTNPDGTMWLSQGNWPTATPDHDPEITFELGGRMTLAAMKLWNYNESGLTGRGVKTADILISDDGVNFSVLIPAKQFDQAPGSATAAFGQTILLTDTSTRYIRLRILENWGDSDSDMAGLSEVQFFDVLYAPMDFDADGDVDLEDYGHMQLCLTGPVGPPGPGCADADLDGDSDVDTGDLGRFLQCVSGPSVPTASICLE